MRAITATARRRIKNGPLTPVERRNRVAGIGLLFSLILYAFCVDPGKVTVFRCFFKEWTGWNCFTCGLSHSLHASARLDWGAAVQHHLFGPFLFLSAWALSAYWIFEIATDRKGMLRVNPGTVRAGIIAVAFIWLAYWLLRL
ncbi:MAG: DUF2752 domain-containing protein [Acidobacteria bacterium]|nr:DUF2752 domain-containing protein [Acidobacteriota bacterium]